MEKTYSFGKKEQNAPERKTQDAPKVETHVRIVQKRSTGQLFVVHETRIIDIKPVTYYEKAVSGAQERGESR